MGDVTALASRVIVIDGGVLRFDGRLATLVARHAPHRRIRLSLLEPVGAAALAAYGEVVELDGASAILEVARERSVDVATRLLSDLAVEDLAIEDPPIEDVVRAVFDDA